MNTAQTLQDEASTPDAQSKLASPMQPAPAVNGHLSEKSQQSYKDQMDSLGAKPGQSIKDEEINQTSNTLREQSVSHVAEDHLRGDEDNNLSTLNKDSATQPPEIDSIDISVHANADLAGGDTNNALGSEQHQVDVQQTFIKITEAIPDQGSQDTVAQEAPTRRIDFSPDLCFTCSSQGELIACSDCARPYCLLCQELIKAPSRQCLDCQREARDKLIQSLKENQRKKTLEREQKKFEEKKAKDEARVKRENEMQQRRDLKEQLKSEQRQRRLEQQAAIDERKRLRDQQLAIPAVIIDPETGNLIPNPQAVVKVEQGPRQTTLKLDTKKKRKTEHALTPAEREKLERNKLIKQQLQIFSNSYPELVEKNSIKYPIEDALILKLPELHGATYQEKPAAYKVLVGSEEFEQLLYIWEFCNNFNEYLEVPTFKIEELKAALSYREDQAQEMTVLEEEQIEWNEQITIRHLREKGFHMVNQLHTALAQCYLADMFPETDSDKPNATSAQIAQTESRDQILNAINKLIEDEQKEQIWPEIIRLLLAHRVEEGELDFGPFSEQMDKVQAKLVGMAPHNYNQSFEFSEKIILLTTLIDGVHDLNDFRAFLNKRIEEKSQYNKEKIEVYQQIKNLEAEQQEILKNHADTDFIQNQEAVNKELDILRQQIAHASRTESRRIKDRIFVLEREKQQVMRETGRLEDLIKKKQAKIASLNEKSFKGSIKTTLLGMDALRAEYWHFKDDPQRIYMRKEEDVRSKTDAEAEEAAIEEIELVKRVVTWTYYEDEDQFEQLLEKLNPKGIREKKLQESLKKIKDRLKLKKGRKPKKQQSIVLETKADTQMEESKDQSEKAEEYNVNDDTMQVDSVVENSEQKPAESQKKESMESSNAVQEEEEEDEEVKHFLFETDKYDSSHKHAVWFGKRIPVKRRSNARNALAKDSAADFFENSITLSMAKKQVQEISNFYSDASVVYDREWEQKDLRDSWENSVTVAESPSQIIPLLQQLDDGMSLPTALLMRGDGADKSKVQRFKLQLFKFWPSTDLRQAWRDFVEEEGSLKDGNLNSLIIILTILERTTEQFAVRQAEKMEKKNRQAVNQCIKGTNYYENGGRQTTQVMTSTGRVQNVISLAPTSSRYERAMNNHTQKKGDYVKYFESSDEEEEEEGEQSEKKDEIEKDGEVSQVEMEAESSEDEQEQTVQTSRSRGRAPTRGGAKTQTTTRGGNQRGGRRAAVQESEQEEEESPEVQPLVESEMKDEENEEEEGEEEASQEWDEYCYVCQDGGNMICCDGCSNVAHLECLKMKAEPTGDWHCKDCLVKLSQKRVTRTQEKKVTQQAQMRQGGITYTSQRGSSRTANRRSNKRY